MRKHYRLRGYQHDDIRKLTATENYGYRNLALLYGVGGGKTLVSLATAQLLYEASPNLAVVVVVPQTDIGAQFISYADCTFEFEGTAHPFPKSHTKSCASGEELRSYLSTRGNRDGKMVVTHWSTFLNCEAEVREALGGGRPMLLIIDEGHHSPELTEEERDELRFAPMVQRLQREYEKLRCFKLTGTPYRTDNKTVLDKDTLTCSMRLVELMRDGFAPKFVLVDIVQVPDDIHEAMACMVQKWLSDGRPSVVIRIKHHADIVEPLRRAFERVGANVIDTTGPEGGEALERAVQRDEDGLLERGAVFLAKGRMIEGANVRTLTHVYFWGAPKSMVVLEQLLGRAMRLRIIGDRITEDGYEPLPHVLPEWVEKTKVTFFFGRSLENVVTDHARLLLRAVLFLSTFASPSWVTRQLLGVKDGIPTARRPHEEPVPLHVDGSEASSPGGREPVPDQRTYALALEVIGLFLRLELASRIHPASLIRIDNRPELFVPHIYNWYDNNRALRREADPVLTIEDIAGALRCRNMIIAERQHSRSGRPRLADDDILEDVLDSLWPSFHADRYEGGKYNLDHASVDYWSAVIGAGVFERIDGQPKTADEIYERVLNFAASNDSRLPDLEDNDPTPRKPVPFKRYHEKAQRMGYAGGLRELACSKHAGPRLVEEIQDALNFLSSRRELQWGKDRVLKELSHRSRTQGNWVAHYYAAEIRVGGYCEIEYPEGESPLEFLGLLTKFSDALNRDLDAVKSVYRNRGLNGLKALLGADIDAQANVALSQH